MTSALYTRTLFLNRTDVPWQMFVREVWILHVRLVMKDHYVQFVVMGIINN